MNAVVFVLLVEDNSGDVFLIERALKQQAIHHILHVIRHVGEAFDFVTRMGKPGEMPCPDLMILDLHLPTQDGPLILAEFRKHPECAEMPVIAITSSDVAKDRAGMATLGVSRYFRKPSDLHEYMRLGAIAQEVLNT